jgi:hypothetical protein
MTLRSCFKQLRSNRRTRTTCHAPSSTICSYTMLLETPQASLIQSFLLVSSWPCALRNGPLQQFCIG